MATTCPVCGCTAATTVHAIVAALHDGDVDAALDAGLLDATPCPTCHADCSAMIQAARAARQEALAARERFRARQARLARRRQEREARRAAVAPATNEDAARPALPPAAAAALARAKARAAGRVPR